VHHAAVKIIAVIVQFYGYFNHTSRSETFIKTVSLSGTFQSYHSAFLQEFPPHPESHRPPSHCVRRTLEPGRREFRTLSRSISYNCHSRFPNIPDWSNMILKHRTQQMSPVEVARKLEDPVPPEVIDDEDEEGNEEDAIAEDAGPGECGVFVLSQPFISFLALGSATGDAKKKKKKKKSKKKTSKKQSEPPRVGLSQLFPTSIFPEGEIQEYKNE